jgi:hypothetical protein
VPSDGERLARLEEKVDGLVADIADLCREELRSRGRLHDLEGFAAAYLETQKVHRRAEDRQYRRLANAIALGGLAMTFGLLVLGALTLYLHAG